MRFDRFVVVAMLLVKVGAAGESASGLEPPVPLFLESFECGDARRWSAVAGGTVPPGPPVGVFVPEVACSWSGPAAGDPFIGHVHVLASPLVADLPPGLPGSREVVIVTYNATDGGSDTCCRRARLARSRQRSRVVAASSMRRAPRGRSPTLCWSSRRAGSARSAAERLRQSATAWDRRDRGAEIETEVKRHSACGWRSRTQMVHASARRARAGAGTSSSTPRTRSRYGRFHRRVAEELAATPHLAASLLSRRPAMCGRVVARAGECAAACAGDDRGSSRQVCVRWRPGRAPRSATTWTTTAAAEVDARATRSSTGGPEGGWTTARFFLRRLSAGRPWATSTADGAAGARCDEPSELARPGDWHLGELEPGSTGAVGSTAFADFGTRRGGASAAMPPSRDAHSARRNRADARSSSDPRRDADRLRRHVMVRSVDSNAWRQRPDSGRRIGDCDWR